MLFDNARSQLHLVDHCFHRQTSWWLNRTSLHISSAWERGRSHRRCESVKGPMIGAMRRVMATVLLIRTRASAPTPGQASFLVYEKGVQVGPLDTNVSRTDEGWRIQGSMQTKGAVPVRIVNLDLLYDAKWF